MYRLIVKKDNDEQVHEFESAELAQLYRDYHLAFGQWNGIVKWVEEAHLTEEQKIFIIDEKTELINGNIVRFYKLSEGLELKIEEADIGSLKQVWNIFRDKRNKLLLFTDWTQLADCPLSMEDRKDYRNYRSYLRVLPSLHNDDSVLYAKVYGFDDWKRGKR